MKLRTYKKTKGQGVKVTALLVLSVFFIASTYFLANQIIAKMRIYNDTKIQLQTLQAEKTGLETEANQTKLKEEELKTQAEQLEQKLDNFKKSYPGVMLDAENQEQKYAYLTFDDGPSKNTPLILDFLKANHIKATFFVVGNESEEAMYKRIAEEGHTLAVHSYTHKYRIIYRNVDNYMKDVNQLSAYLEKVTGVKPNIMRFPGGSNNKLGRKYSGFDIMGQVIPKVKAEGFTYFDWNVDSADANKPTQDEKVIINSVLSQAKVLHHAVILMHDAPLKTTTVDALPEIVQGLRKQGFTFEALSPQSKLVQFR